MIVIYDEEHHFFETGELLPVDTEVHLLHFKDNYPLCWDLDQTGAYAGTSTDEEVTCKACLKYMAEF